MKKLVNTEKILTFMKENKLTKSEFAKKCHINLWNLQAVLSERTNYNIVYLFKIAKVMQIPVSQMFN